MEQYYKNAIEDSENIFDLVDTLFENIEDHQGDEELFAQSHEILAKWGVNVDTTKLITLLGFLGTKEQIAKIGADHGLAKIIQGNPGLKEQFFYELQETMNEIEFEEWKGTPTLEFASRLGKSLIAILSACGYELHPEGLKTVIRLYANDVMEGIGVEWYESNPTYDVEEFPYYDGVENENDEFWNNLDILNI